MRYSILRYYKIISEKNISLGYCNMDSISFISSGDKICPGKPRLQEMKEQKH